MQILIFLLAAVGLAAQTPAPVFTREGIVPRNKNNSRSESKVLAPSMVVEIYGQHLAPERWCGENRAPAEPYPVEICGVRVLVGSSPSELMYVSASQINLKTPTDAPTEGSAPVQVCVRQVCTTVVMPFGRQR